MPIKRMHVYIIAILFIKVTGISILALGIWTKVDLYKYMELSTIYYKDSPWILIAVGALIVIVGSFGCCCTAKGNVVLLYMVNRLNRILNFSFEK